MQLAAAHVQCHACAGWQLKAAPLAESGFGLCTHAPRHEHFAGSTLRDCPRFHAAKPETIAARTRFLAPETAL